MSAKLLEVISHEYGEKTQKSKSLYEEAKGLFPGGVQHNIRFFPPYPFYVDRAKGQYIQDIDGNRYVDFWMGHMGLILGIPLSLWLKRCESKLGMALTSGL